MGIYEGGRTDKTMEKIKLAISTVLIGLTMLSVSVLDSDKAIVPGIISLVCMVTLLGMSKAEDRHGRS